MTALRLSAPNFHHEQCQEKMNNFVFPLTFLDFSERGQFTLTQREIPWLFLDLHQKERELLHQIFHYIRTWACSTCFAPWKFMFLQCPPVQFTATCHNVWAKSTNVAAILKGVHSQVETTGLTVHKVINRITPRMGTFKTSPPNENQPNIINV